MAEFKDRLIQAMVEKNLKAVELCELTGIPKSAMSYYMSGKATPKNDRLWLLAKTLNVSDPWLAGYDVDMEREQSQKELDDLSDTLERLEKDKGFRQLILKINHLKPEQLNLIVNLVSAIQQN